MKKVPVSQRFDTRSIAHALYAQTDRRLAFSAKNTAGARSWQKALRREITGLLGGFGPRVPLAPRVTGRRVFPHYTRQSVVFTSAPGIEVFAHFLLPRSWKPGAPGLPCVVCLPGHGRGVDSIVGVTAGGQMRPWGRWGEYQHDFALQCVSRGLAVLAVEQMGFGRRRDPPAVARGPGHSSCEPAAGAALLLGATMTGWRVRDAMRAIDWLVDQPAVDARRIGIMGISGGGTITLFTAALDTRIRAAVVSGYFNTFRDSIGSIRHCIDNYVPGILRVAEMSDIAGCIAPRSLFVESGTDDPIFPVQATREAYREARRIYAAFDAEERFGMEIFHGSHRFWGREAFRFLGREL